MGRLLVYFFDLLFIYIVGWLIRRLLQGPAPGAQVRKNGPGSRTGGASVQGATARDPVCGMFVSTELSHHLKAGNQTLHFCSEECLHRYQAETIRS